MISHVAVKRALRACGLRRGISGAARELDERLYRQEFEASFERTALGRAYHAFSREANVRPCSYTTGGRLIWPLDFNVNPMCLVIAQRSKDTVEVLDELIIDDATHGWRASGSGNEWKHPSFGALAIYVMATRAGIRGALRGRTRIGISFGSFSYRCAGRQLLP